MFERTLPNLRVPAGASWCAFSATWLCGAALTAAFLHQDWRVTALARSPGNGSPISSRSDDVRNVRIELTLSPPADFVMALPGVVDPDAMIRLTARLAQDQDVRISQMQIEPVATDVKHFGQEKFAIQLRGNYSHIKNVVIGLLAKFPGLTLQRLTIHHRDATPGNPADKGSDEATLELIQFLRPAALS